MERISCPKFAYLISLLKKTMVSIRYDDILDSGCSTGLFHLNQQSVINFLITAKQLLLLNLGSIYSSLSYSQK